MKFKLLFLLFLPLLCTSQPAFNYLQCGQIIDENDWSVDEPIYKDFLIRNNNQCNEEITQTIYFTFFYVPDKIQVFDYYTDELIAETPYVGRDCEDYIFGNIPCESGFFYKINDDVNILQHYPVDWPWSGNKPEMSGILKYTTTADFIKVRILTNPFFNTDFIFMLDCYQHQYQNCVYYNSQNITTCNIEDENQFYVDYSGCCDTIHNIRYNYVGPILEEIDTVVCPNTILTLPFENYENFNDIIYEWDDGFIGTRQSAFKTDTTLNLTIYYNDSCLITQTYNIFIDESANLDIITDYYKYYNKIVIIDYSFLLDEYDIFYQGQYLTGGLFRYFENVDTSLEFNFVSKTTGCIVTKTINIFHYKENVYIPNAFSPNNDGNNDTFEFFTKSNFFEKVLLYQIFDRWGELIYSQENILYSDITFWDGTFNNKVLNTGVYVYLIILELNDGTKKTYKGDIILIK